MKILNDWTAIDRRVAIWSALGTLLFGLLYAPTLVAAFVSAGNVNDPLTDPFLGILYRFELLRAYLIDGFPPPRKAGEVSEFLWSVPVDLDGLRDGLM